MGRSRGACSRGGTLPRQTRGCEGARGVWRGAQDPHMARGLCCLHWDALCLLPSLPVHPRPGFSPTSPLVFPDHASSCHSLQHIIQDLTVMSSAKTRADIMLILHLGGPCSAQHSANGNQALTVLWIHSLGPTPPFFINAVYFCCPDRDCSWGLRVQLVMFAHA